MWPATHRPQAPLPSRPEQSPVDGAVRRRRKRHCIAVERRHPWAVAIVRCSGISVRWLGHSSSLTAPTRQLRVHAVNRYVHEDRGRAAEVASGGACRGPSQRRTTAGSTHVQPAVPVHAEWPSDAVQGVALQQSLLCAHVWPVRRADKETGATSVRAATAVRQASVVSAGATRPRGKRRRLAGSANGAHGARTEEAAAAVRGHGATALGRAARDTAVRRRLHAT